ncbi:MAG: hypothetical protein IT442_12480 [Phycisphaeraceae bacterium]|nr:hypothetical protein [Phycisphaeraceae bacterium]
MSERFTISGQSEACRWTIVLDGCAIDVARSIVVPREIAKSLPATPTSIEPASPPLADASTSLSLAGSGGENVAGGHGSVVRGLVGLAKSHLGIDRSPDDLIAHRWQVCSSNAHGPNRCCDAGLCTACGCHVSSKIRIASEVCPLGKW